MAARDRLGLGEALRTRWYIGLRAGLSVGVPLAVGVAAGRPSWGALASMGGLAGFYGPDTPYPYRIRLVAGVGLALTVVVPLSSLCAPVAWLSVLLCGAVTGVAAFVCLALRVPPPREYLIVLATLAATGIPAGGLAPLRDCALVAAGAVTGGLISLAPALGGRRAPAESKTVTAAWRAVHEVLRTAGTPGAARARAHAVAALSQAHDTQRQAGTAATDERLRSLASAELALAGALSASIDAAAPLDAATGRRVLAAAEAARDGEETDTGLDRPGALVRLRAALSRDSVAVPAAARIAVTVAAGAGLGRALGLDHSYWVALTAAAALQANNVTFLVRRSLNRLAGTIAGIGIAWPVFAAHPVPAVVAAVATACQFAGEVLIKGFYGLAMVFVTVLALSLYDLGVPQARIGTAVGARVLDTAIGVALVIALRLLLWRRAAGSRLPQVQARALRAAADVFRARWLGPAAADLVPARRRLEEDLLRMRALTDDATADAVFGSRDASAEQVTLAVGGLAMLALGIPFGRPRPSGDEAAAFITRLDELAASLQNGAPPPDSPATALHLPRYPRAVSAAQLLASAMSGRSAAGARRPH
ncbi:MAG TPA: FUSC family protein [Trebonia sp.]|nr:FUSC family protein [Trebonia sp.]